MKMNIINIVDTTFLTIWISFSKLRSAPFHWKPLGLQAVSYSKQSIWSPLGPREIDRPGLTEQTFCWLVMKMI